MTTRAISSPPCLCQDHAWAELRELGGFAKQVLEQSQQYDCITETTYECMVLRSTQWKFVLQQWQQQSMADNGSNGNGKVKLKAFAETLLRPNETLDEAVRNTCWSSLQPMFDKFTFYKLQLKLQSTCFKTLFCFSRIVWAASLTPLAWIDWRCRISQWASATRFSAMLAGTQTTKYKSWQKYKQML